MKKIFIVLTLVAIVFLPAVAKSNFAIGLEMGQPSGVTFVYSINDKINVYTSTSIGFRKTPYIDIHAGYQNMIASFNIKETKFNINGGVQVGGIFCTGDSSDILLTVKGIASISHSWSLETSGDFTAYVRGGIGAGFKIKGRGNNVNLDWTTVLGCIYHF